MVDPLNLTQNGHHFAHDIFKRIFVYENFCISIQISLTYIPMCLIDEKPALVQIMTWDWTGNKMAVLQLLSNL